MEKDFYEEFSGNVIVSIPSGTEFTRRTNKHGLFCLLSGFENGESNPIAQQIIFVILNQNSWMTVYTVCHGWSIFVQLNSHNSLYECLSSVVKNHAILPNSYFVVSDTPCHSYTYRIRNPQLYALTIRYMIKARKLCDIIIYLQKWIRLCGHSGWAGFLKLLLVNYWHCFDLLI